MKKVIFLISRVWIALVLAVFPLSSALAQEQIVEINKHGVNIRKSPSQSGEIIMKAPLGMQFSSLGKSGQWFKVKLSDGATGYVMKGTLAQMLLSPCNLKEIATSFSFTNSAVTKKGSFESAVTSTYLIEVDGNKITAEYESRYADTKGSMRFLGNNTYSGRVEGNTLILDYDVSAEEKLTNPIMMYYSCRLSGLAVDGVLYKDDSAM